jgi:hypothetical protein
MAPIDAKQSKRRVGELAVGNCADHGAGLSAHGRCPGGEQEGSDGQVGVWLRVLSYAYRVGKRCLKALQAWMDLERCSRAGREML